MKEPIGSRIIRLGVRGVRGVRNREWTVARMIQMVACTVLFRPVCWQLAAKPLAKQQYPLFLPTQPDLKFPETGDMIYEMGHNASRLQCRHQLVFELRCSIN